MLHEPFYIQIYGTGAEGFLYLFPENDTPAQRIADVIDIVQHLHSENVNIQVRLVTTHALYSAVNARLARLWDKSFLDLRLGSTVRGDERGEGRRR